MDEITAVEEVSPSLLVREVRPVLNWNEWLERWKMAVTSEEMSGLIHMGFQIPLDYGVRYGERKYTYYDRIAFYFGLADGWANRDLLKVEGRDEKSYFAGYNRHGMSMNISESQARQELARKAFFLLCTNFFKLEFESRHRQTADEVEYAWMERFVGEDLFPIFLHFFRSYERWEGQPERRNLPRPVGDEDARNEEKYVHDFFLRLARFLWTWHERRIQSYWKDEEKKKLEEENIFLRGRIAVAQPEMIELLFAIGKGEVLREWLLSFDGACLKKLEEIALRNRLRSHQHPVLEDRKVETIDEALLVGSRAAWLLKEYELKKAEFDRLSALRAAEWRKRESERDIERLSKAK